jgi:hypothetical protein
MIEKLEKYLMTKQRISDHGEVYTRAREVNAMLDMVNQETERIESRFLEPACGKGNFMVEVLKRKLKVVEKRYRKSQIEYERYSVIALSSIYGIDILSDNVEICRNRLFYIFDEKYSSLFQKKSRNDCRRAVKYILSKNIICGDALTLKTTGENPQPIIFSEWSLVKGSMIKRRDFAFHELIPEEKITEPSIFTDPNLFKKSDLGGDVFIPEPVKEYPLTHFLRISDAECSQL